MIIEFLKGYRQVRVSRWPSYTAWCFRIWRTTI